MRNLKPLYLLLIFVLISSKFTFAEEFDVVYLGGQSNMEGFGSVDELPDELRMTIPGCYIYHASASMDQDTIGGDGQWMPLKPGHGTDFKSDSNSSTYSNRFGVEMSLASELQRLRPGRKIALIKYARNGSSIHRDATGKWGCWEPDFLASNGDNRSINQFDHFLATIRKSTTSPDINQDGSTDTLNPIGIVWMQGESDASFTEEIAQQYESNLKRLMDLMRAALRVDDLPVVIGRISDSAKEGEKKVWQHGELLRNAQASFVEKDSAASLVTTTDTYGYSDRWHYDSMGYIDLGKQFAKSLADLQGNKSE